MPTFRVQLPDGRVARIDAADGEAALAFAKGLPSKVQQDAKRRVGNMSDRFRAFANGVTLGGADQLDAVGAALETGSVNLGRKLTGKPDVGYGMGDAYKAVLEANHAAERDYRAKRPVSSAAYEISGGLLMPGAGALGDFVKGTEGAKGLLQGTSLAARSVRGATAGGLLGGLAGGLSADPGHVVKGVKSGATVGAVTGGVLPAAGEVVSGTARAATRLANRLSGGELLPATREAGVRLAEALRKDGLDDAQIKEALNAWLKTGASSPALVDLAGPNTQRLLRAAAGKGGPANTSAVKYVDEVAGNLQDRAIDRTRALTADRRTLPALESDVTSRIAANSQPPQVTPGAAGAQVHHRLNAQYDAGRQAVNGAYDAVGASDAQLGASGMSELPARIRVRLDENLITPEVMGSLNPATRGILSEIDSLSGRAGRMAQGAQPDAAASLEAGIPQGGGAEPTFRLSGLERVRKAINARLPNAQGEDKIALEIAKREFDGWLGDALQSGGLSGDPEAINLLQTARGLHAQQRTTFGGDDLLQRLTERDRHGAGITNVVSPDDASNAILGRSGVSNRQDMARDLARLRDQLGPQSPEWRGVQLEAQSRILGREAGSEGFGRAWTQLTRDNPELGKLLATPADNTALTAKQGAIQGAVADRNAVAAGRKIMSAAADQYGADLSAVGARKPLSQVGAARELEGAIERPTEGATGVLNRIATSNRLGRNLSETFGAEEADRYRAAMGNEIDRLRNARFIDPGNGSQTALRLEDSGLVDIPHPSPAGIARFALTKLAQGLTLTDAEREAIVKIGTMGAGDSLDHVNFDRIAPRSQYALPLAAIAAERGQ